MFQFLFRSLGMVVLALALVSAILDITRSIASSTMLLTPFAQTWQSLSPDTYASAQQSIEAHLHPALWDPAMVFFLSLPTWLLLWLVSMILLYIGQKRENPYGRFASR